MNCERRTNAPTQASQQKEAASAPRISALPGSAGQTVMQWPQLIGNQALGYFIQTKLKVSSPKDEYEQEADRVADQVMRMADGTPLAARVSKCCSTTTLQRACAKCEEEEEEPQGVVQRQALDKSHEELELQRKAEKGNDPGSKVTAQIDNLKSGGQGLPDPVRNFFEPRFGYNFDSVRVHANAGATAALSARAFTFGRDIVFGLGEYSPETSDGRHLLAHELAHVVQQGAAEPAQKTNRQSQSGHDLISRWGETRSLPMVRQRTTTPFVGRVNTRETAAVLRRGTVAGSGVQFWPLQVASTVIGPVSGQGGLLNDRRIRLSVIVGQSMSLRRIAALILPLWNSATPFTPPGSTIPIPIIPLTADELARGLLVYNRYYLRLLSQPGASMTGWSGGLRFPLPVEIDASGVATVNVDLIRDLAGTFEAAWEPLLDQSAAAVIQPTPAALNQAVTAFLATTPDVSARGIALSTRSITNPVEASAFVLAIFNQAGAGRFDLALSFMDWLVNPQVSLLASQRDGNTILGAIRTALAAAPATLTTRQQESLNRANLMLGLVTAVVPRNPPFAQPNAISPAGAHMIANFEGFCPNLYDDAMSGCGTGRGHCTIGFGHLVHLNPCNGTDPSEAPFLGGIARPAAETLFANELTRFVNDVSTRVTVPLSQAQFDALVSFHFNTGRLNALSPSINANNFAAVPGIMNQFVNAHVNGVVTQLPGLVTRRAAEGTLFSAGTYPR
jgi:GH24 family phage-related lysozyme (muramidase)